MSHGRKEWYSIRGISKVVHGECKIDGIDLGQSENFEIDACSSVMNRVIFSSFSDRNFSDYFYDRFIRLQGRRARDGALSFC